MTTAAVEAKPAEPQPGLVSRMLGVILSPTETFGAVARYPRWFGVFAVNIILTTALQAWFMSTEPAHQALLDQAAEGSPQDIAGMQAMLPYMPMIQAVVIPVFGLVVTLALAGILFGVFGAMLGGTGTFRQVLAVVAHSGAVSALGQLFIVPMNYFRGSVSSPTTLSVFFPMVDEDGALGTLLGTVDLFLVWWTVVLAIGMAVLYRRKTRPVILSFLAVYAVIAVVIVLVKAMRGA